MTTFEKFVTCVLAAVAGFFGVMVAHWVKEVKRPPSAFIAFRDVHGNDWNVRPTEIVRIRPDETSPIHSRQETNGPMVIHHVWRERSLVEMTGGDVVAVWPSNTAAIVWAITAFQRATK